ncbi:uncharacterized protein LOC132261916 isoform X2 [Phlebotomus argentipes]|uniref:uncharacterized protein LOC132261916 isoform X2 n=1 Tax=Phlebotomus argentipes TaxID=94469 RepID=UPI002892C09C|nr:uncharacterized protein LOC132261916 isoform X2 [Phlebotomus argentipes]
MNKFSMHEMAELIEIVKNEPILWSKHIRTYRGAPERANIMDNIAMRFKKSPADVEKCWSAMREKYKREKFNDSSEVSRKYRKERWELMDKLSFLDSVYGTAPSKPPMEILPAPNGNNVTVRRIAPKALPVVPGEIVGVGKLKLANLADLQEKPTESPMLPEHIKIPTYPANVERMGSISPIFLSTNHEFISEQSDATDSERPVSPVSSVASSTLFPINTIENQNGSIEFKMSQKSRKIRRMENERRELLNTLKVLTRSKSAAELYGEYLTKKLSNWCTEKQNKAIKMFNRVISEVDEDF